MARQARRSLSPFGLLCEKSESKLQQPCLAMVKCKEMWGKNQLPKGTAWALKSLKHRLRSWKSCHYTGGAEGCFPSGQGAESLPAPRSTVGLSRARDRPAALAQITVAGKGLQQRVFLHELVMGPEASGDPGMQVGCYYVLKSMSLQLAGASWQKGANITPSYYGCARPLFLPVETAVSEPCSFPCFPNGMRSTACLSSSGTREVEKLLLFSTAPASVKPHLHAEREWLHQSGPWKSILSRKHPTLPEHGPV